jgi:hypothetical protein
MRTSDGPSGDRERPHSMITVEGDRSRRGTTFAVTGHGSGIGSGEHTLDLRESCAPACRTINPSTSPATATSRCSRRGGTGFRSVRSELLDEVAPLTPSWRTPAEPSRRLGEPLETARTQARCDAAWLSWTGARASRELIGPPGRPGRVPALPRTGLRVARGLVDVLRRGRVAETPRFVGAGRVGRAGLRRATSDSWQAAVRGVP